MASGLSAAHCMSLRNVWHLYHVPADNFVRIISVLHAKSVLRPLIVLAEKGQVWNILCKTCYLLALSIVTAGPTVWSGQLELFTSTENVACISNESLNKEIEHALPYLPQLNADIKIPIIIMLNGGPPWCRRVSGLFRRSSGIDHSSHLSGKARIFRPHAKPVFVQMISLVLWLASYKGVFPHVGQLHLLHYSGSCTRVSYCY